MVAERRPPALGGTKNRESAYWARDAETAVLLRQTLYC